MVNTLIVIFLTIDPWDNDKLGEGDDHERERWAVPIHDLQVVDAALETEVKVKVKP